MIRLPVRGFASSTLDGVREMADAAEELGDEDAPAFRLLADAYDGDALRFEARDGETLFRVLVDLANSEDATAEHNPDAEARRMARAARDGLGTLATKALRAWQATRGATSDTARP